MTSTPRRTVDLEGYDGLAMYLGDLHNHCGISYGHGSIEDAFANARLQLDFGSVTGHAWWHDIPRDVPELADTVAYHLAGFERLANCWDHVQEVTAAAHADGEFVSLLSFEWHSSTYGDHCVYYKGDRGDIIRAGSLEEMRAEMRRRAAAGQPMMAIPHHIGYRAGSRGINWAAYTDEFAPVVEMISMHGCGESDDAPRPYLHTMGPRDAASTARHGLGLGHRFGMIGSTDHHSAHPGSFGYGRAAVWADELTRDGIWEAIQARRVYAVTGDPIAVGFGINEAVMGGVAHASTRRRIRAHVVGRDTLDYVEVVRNGQPIHRVSRPDLVGSAPHSDFAGTVGFSVGWGRAGQTTAWDVRLRVEGGRMLDVEPRLRGEDILAPVDKPPDAYHFSSWGYSSTWGRSGDHGAWLRTVAHANPNPVTDGTQGLSLRIEGDERTRVVATVNGQEVARHLGELRDDGRSGYLAGFVSPAYKFSRAVPDSERTATIDVEDESTTSDWYTLRVRQTNDQWAWSSPIWVEA